MASNTAFRAELIFKLPTYLVKKLNCLALIIDSSNGMPDSIRTSLFGVFDLTPKQDLMSAKYMASSCLGIFGPNASQLCSRDDVTQARRTLSFTEMGSDKVVELVNSNIKLGHVQFQIIQGARFAKVASKQRNVWYIS